MKVQKLSRERNCIIRIYREQRLELCAYRVSSDITSEMYTNVHLKESKTVCLDEVCPGKYLSCIWDKRWYVGIVLEKTDGAGDFLVKCMKQREYNFFWPQREDKVIISIDHVVCLLSSPLIHSPSGRQYEIAEEEKKVSTLNDCNVI